MRQITTREQKIRFLKALQKGAVDVDIIKQTSPIWLKLASGEFFNPSTKQQLTDTLFNEYLQTTRSEIIVLPDNTRDKLYNEQRN